MPSHAPHPAAGPSPALLRIDAAGLADAHTSIAPASLLVEFAEPAPASSPFSGPFSGDARILAVGSPAEINAHPAAAHARALDAHASVLLPALANAHAHLDLTHIGPIPHDPASGFMNWIAAVRQGRRTDPAAIAESVALGAARSRAGGVCAVGDIAGHVHARASRAALDALAATRLAGLASLECFAIGPITADALAHLDALLDTLPPPTPDLRIGLSPHAPYTVSLAAYHALLERAGRLGLPVCTHLAETPEEREFVAHATGPKRAFLESIGLWDASVEAELRHAPHPIAHLAGVLRDAAERRVPFLIAHANDAPDDAIDLLAQTGTRVVYCPRASDYFAAHTHFGPHRYRDMLAAGIPVALGTDSILNLPAPATTLSTLDEARFLHARDATDPRTLLAMATTHAAAALALDPRDFTLSPGARPRAILAVPLPTGTPRDPAGAVLATDAPVRFLYARNSSDLTEL